MVDRTRTQLIVGTAKGRNEEKGVKVRNWVIY